MPVEQPTKLQFLFNAKVAKPLALNVPTAKSGLGLAIVQEIMRAHHGSVDVGDNPGGGAAFTLNFRHAVHDR